MTTQTDLPNTAENVRRIGNTPESELGEGGPAIIFDVPDDLQYDENEIIEILWTGKEILLWYEASDSSEEYISFSTEERDETIVVTDYGPGILSATEVFRTRTHVPHAESLTPIYEWLMSEGIEFADLD